VNRRRPRLPSPHRLALRGHGVCVCVCVSVCVCVCVCGACPVEIHTHLTSRLCLSRLRRVTERYGLGLLPGGAFDRWREIWEANRKLIICFLPHPAGSIWITPGTPPPATTLSTHEVTPPRPETFVFSLLNARPPHVFFLFLYFPSCRKQ